MMMDTFFKRFLRKKKEKPFSTWQIELTTRCPLRCKMCIRASSKDWQHQDMSLEDFKKILPYLKAVEHVVLEGWGESLLHKDLLDCIRLVKKEGPQVGFVTSGKGLTEDYVSELLEAGLDFIGFSIAGITPETHAMIRVHSNLSEILHAIRLFQKKRDLYSLSRPKMHLVFLMLRENIHEVPGLPAFAEKLGIKDIFLTHLIHMMTPSQENQKIFSYEGGENRFDRFLREAEENAKRFGVKLKRPALFPTDVPVCEENPLRNLYISSSGEVSPCVYLFPPLCSPFKRIFKGQEYWIEKVSFGNIFNIPFSEIWDREDYLHFRDCFTEREKKIKELSFSLLGGEMTKRLKDFIFPDPPEPCKTCHKILGF